MVNRLLVALVSCATIGFAHNSYTGGYSSAPGRSTCASSCHGGASGTLVVTGFPAAYQPQQMYLITVTHNGGSRIVNFNATTRVGSSSTVAGTFTPVSNSVSYTGADGGVYASPHLIDTARFQWTAPAGGTGPVNFYAAAFQGTTSSASGQSSRVTFLSSENLTSVETPGSVPGGFSLSQNYPNPFNPTTKIEFRVSSFGFVSLKVFDMAGHEVATLVNGQVNAGTHRATFTAEGLASGVYLYRLATKGLVETKKLLLLR